MILVDSSVWIDYFNGRDSRETGVLDSALDRDHVVIGDLILAEVLRGFRHEADFRRALDLLGGLDCPVIGGREVAVAAARHYRFLRGRGVTVRKTVDSLIAAFCLRTGLPLLTADRDFLPYGEFLGLELP